MLSVVFFQFLIVKGVRRPHILLLYSTIGRTSVVYNLVITYITFVRMFMDTTYCKKSTPWFNTYSTGVQLYVPNKWI